MTEAGDDPEKIERAKTMIRFLSETALTMRLVLAASYTLGTQVGSKLCRPLLSVASAHLQGEASCC